MKNLMDESQGQCKFIRLRSLIGGYRGTISLLGVVYSINQEVKSTIINLNAV